MDFDKMTDKQIIEYVNNNCSYMMRQSMHMAITGMYDIKPNKKEVLRLIRKALDEDKEFGCGYYDGESCDGPRQASISMWIDPENPIEIYPKTVFHKENPKDKVFWVDAPGTKGEFLFSFDKKRVFNLFADYPNNLTAKEKAIFDKENPFWADFFKDRQ